MARKVASKKAAARAAATADTSDARSRSSTSAKSVAAKALPFLVVAFVLFFALNRLYLMPQRAASLAAAKRSSSSGKSGDTYLARTDVVSHRRVDVPCYIKKVRPVVCLCA